jgi:hypothetical protein
MEEQKPVSCQGQSRVALRRAMAQAGGMTAYTSTLQPDRGTLAAAALAVAATALFAWVGLGTALPGLGRAMGMDLFDLRRLVVTLGAGVLIGGVWAGRVFDLVRQPQRLGHSYRAAGAALCLALMAWGPGLLTVAVSLVGLAYGWLVVVLVTGLRSVVGPRHLGTVIGLGLAAATALALGMEALGWAPRTLALVTAMLVAMGSFTVPWLLPEEPSVALGRDHRWLGAGIWGIVGVVVAWLALAGQPMEVVMGGWDTGGPVLALAAVVVGVWLDRGGWVAPMATATALVFAGSLWHWFDAKALAAGWVTAAGWGAALVAWVTFAARGGRSWQPAWVLAVAGTVGVSLGFAWALGGTSVGPLGLGVGLAIVLGVTGYRASWR